MLLSALVVAHVTAGCCPSLLLLLPVCQHGKLCTQPMCHLSLPQTADACDLEGHLGVDRASHCIETHMLRCTGKNRTAYDGSSGHRCVAAAWHPRRCWRGRYSRDERAHRGMRHGD